MIAQSPHFKLNPMIPLSVHQKMAIIEDEPDDLDQEHAKISFNENLIVFKKLEISQYQKNYTNIQQTILKLKGQPNIGWINPIFKDEIKRSTSILKYSQSPTRNCSISL